MFDLTGLDEMTNLSLGNPDPCSDLLWSFQPFHLV
jgi:hypothetical protein